MQCTWTPVLNKLFALNPQISMGKSVTVGNLDIANMSTFGGKLSQSLSLSIFNSLSMSCCSWSPLCFDCLFQ